MGLDISMHPCFNSEAHVKYGRIHLPVSPSCNIQCRFCKRGFNKWENRPGVAGTLLNPDEALRTVDKALTICPDITVAGVAGPGDSLASNHAIAAFRLIHKHFPQLINCLSTNGLLLQDRVDELAEVGVKTVTVTVNAVDTSVLPRICSYIIVKGKTLTGEAAASQLIPSQLSGIEAAIKCGLIVKVNTVLIPGVNSGHIEQLAKTVKTAGAGYLNIIPLIPQHELWQSRPPTCRELETAQATAEKYLPVFRHCKRCRADACGIPGSGIDFAEKLYAQPASTFSHG